MKNLNKYIQKGIDYSTYVLNEENLIASKKEFEYKKYHEINFQRLKRNGKTAASHINLTTAERAGFNGTQLLIITEGWCGDAAQIIPYANEIALQAQIPLTLVYRDENPELMDQFLTNGSKSIPVIIITDLEGNYLNHFAPRPKEAQTLMLNLKEKNVSKDEISLALQKWYNKDKGALISKNIISLVSEATI